MARRQCSEYDIVQMLDECDLSDLEDVLSESSVEINIKYLMLTMLESLNYSFRNPKKHNLSNLPHQTVEKLKKKPWGPPRTPAW